MNKKIYGANLPFQASELELKGLFSKLEISCPSRMPRTGKLANREGLRSLRGQHNGRQLAGQRAIVRRGSGGDSHNN